MPRRRGEGEGFMWPKQRRPWRVFATNGRVRTLCCRVAAAFIALGVARSSHATIVDRVVAVVGDRAILLSEVMQRARASELRL